MYSCVDFAFVEIGDVHNIFAFWFKVKAHHKGPLLGIFGSSVIIYIIKLFQKCDAFNFGFQFWCLALKFWFFTILVLFNMF